MTRIIAGVFNTMDEANRTRDALTADGFAGQDVSVFFNNSPGQHGEMPAGGDEVMDPNADRAHKGAAAGAAVGAGVGLAGLAAGPAGLAAAGVAAYVGSLAGAAGATDDDATRRRPAGVMIAVNATSREDDAIRVLRAQGADNIERADGHWENGQWADFDPVTNPRLVDQPELHDRSTTG